MIGEKIIITSFDGAAGHEERAPSAGATDRPWQGTDLSARDTKTGHNHART